MRMLRVPRAYTQQKQSPFGKTTEDGTAICRTRMPLPRNQPIDGPPAKAKVAYLEAGQISSRGILELAYFGWVNQYLPEL